MTGRIIVGRYRLLRKLGEGGMGSVWLAQDQVLGRQVAVKEINFPRTGGEADLGDPRERAKREAVVAAGSRHSNIVTIYDVVLEAGDPWIVMEYIEGRSLAELIKDHSELLTEVYIATIGRQVLDALSAVHKAKALHRDVKPANILIADGSGDVFLVDFGIATIEGHSMITRIGLQVGTPEFMAPERFHGRGVGPPSDLWSLGATLYTALERRPPFLGHTEQATITAVLDEEPVSSTKGGRLMPVISRMLTKDPRARIGAAEAGALLDQIATGATGETGQGPASRPRPRPRPRERPAPQRSDHHKPVRRPPRPVPPMDRADQSDYVHRPDQADHADRAGGTDQLRSFADIAAQEPARAAAFLQNKSPRAAGGLIDDLSGAAPAAAAVVGAMRPEVAGRILNYATSETVAVVLLGLPAERAAGVLVRMGARPAAAVVEMTPAQSAAAALRTLPANRVAALLNHVAPKASAAILLLSEAAGTTEVLDAMSEPISLQVIRHMRERPSD
jgi:serine/threonine protein kinase